MMVNEMITDIIVYMVRNGMTLAEIQKTFLEKYGAPNLLGWLNNNKDAVICMEVVSGKSINTICKKLDVDVVDVIKSLGDHGYYMTGQNVNRRGEPSVRNIVKFLYTFNKELTIEEISEMTRVDISTIKEILVVDEDRVRKESELKFLTQLTLEDMKNMLKMLDDGINRKTIVMKYNVSESLFTKIVDRKNAILNSDLIFSEYVNGRDVQEISDQYGVGTSYIYWLLEKGGIKKHFKHLSIDTEERLMLDYADPEISNNTLCSKYNITHKKLKAVINKHNNGEGEE